MTKPLLRLLRLPKDVSLLQQLWLEEALFRSHTGNWFVLKDGVATPTIVLGISGCVLSYTDAIYLLFARCMVFESMMSALRAPYYPQKM
jgi:hypothetical protein